MPGHLLLLSYVQNFPFIEYFMCNNTLTWHYLVINIGSTISLSKGTKHYKSKFSVYHPLVKIYINSICKIFLLKFL